MSRRFDNDDDDGMTMAEFNRRLQKFLDEREGVTGTSRKRFNRGRKPVRDVTDYRE